MHDPVQRPAPTSPELEFVATRDIALPAALLGMAMTAVVSAALGYAAMAPQRSAAPQEPAAVSVLAA